MNKDRTLIIYDSVKHFVPFIKSKGVKCFPSFRTVTKLEKIFRKISFKSGINKKEWYGEWKNHLSEVDCIIVFATNRYDYIHHIAKNNPEIRIIVWYWNPIFRCFNPDALRRENIEYWSFDREDCKKFNLQYNSTFYFDNISISKNELQKDVLFVGADKGRKNALNELEKILNNKNVSTNFHIVPDNNTSNPDEIKPIDYSDYLHLISSCKVILDYIQIGQAGLTLRPMESIFFKKKLITNDINILNEDFYNSDNIFVLDHDNIDRIVDFINAPYVNIDENIVSQYDFMKWLKRFDR